MTRMHLGYYAVFFMCLSTVTSHDCIQMDNKLFCQGAKYILSIPYIVDTVYVDQSMGTEGLQLLITKKVKVIVTSADERLCRYICEQHHLINWRHQCQCEVSISIYFIIKLIAYQYHRLCNIAVYFSPSTK